MADKTSADIIKQHKTECDSTITAFKRDLQKVRSGRASSGLVENIQVEHYGSRTPLLRLGQISVPEARMIVVQVYDTSAIQSIEKAIHSSGLGLNPARDGNIIRISVPALTEETRKEIVRHLSKLAEEIRVSVRNHRRDANDALKKLEKDGVLSKDDSKKSQDVVQKQTDAAIQQVDALLKAKEAECLEV